jgi:diguanylate cyclase (GGDEF)-like protein
MHLAERLRAAVSADTISFPEGSVRVSTSVGVTAWSGGAVPTPLMLIGAADEALFQAKAAGRNRVACKNLLVTPTEVPIG